MLEPRDLRSRLPRPQWQSTPAAGLLLGYCTGVCLILGCCAPFENRCLWLAAASCLAAGCALTHPGPRRQILLCAVLGALLAARQVHRTGHEDRGMALQRGAAGHLAGVVVEAVGDETLAPSLIQSGSVDVRARWMRPYGQCPAILLNETVVLRFEPDTPLPPYGVAVQAEGLLIRPAGPAFPDDFDYARHLRARGIRWTFEVRSWQQTSPPRGWRRATAAVLRCRDRMAEHISHGLPKDEAAILRAVTLGFRGGLPVALRRRFLQAGLLHIFAISGLHTGMVGAIVLGLLRVAGAPLRLRHMALPAILGIYVYATGAGGAAVRAWVMMSVWSLNSARLRPSVPFNTLAVSALLLLLANPFALLRIGFQYSFGAVGMLVLTWPHVSRLAAAVAERPGWVPRQHRARWRQNLVTRSAQLAFSGLVAWLAGAGLTIAVNGLFTPGAVPAGMVSAALLPLALTCGLLKAMMGMFDCTWAAGAMNNVLHTSLWLLDQTARFASCAPASFPAARPGLLWMIAYYGVLLTALQVRGATRVRAAAAAGLALLLTVAVALPLVRPWRAAVFHGAGTGVRAAVLAPPRHCPVVIADPRSTAGWTCRRWLACHGYREVDTLVLLQPPGNEPEWTRRFVESLDPAVLITPDRPPPEALAAASFRDAGAPLRRVRRHRRLPVPPPRGDSLLPGQLGIEVRRSRRRNRDTVEVQVHRDALSCRLLWQEDESGVVLVKATGTEGTSRYLRAAASLRPHTWTVELE